MIDNDQSKKITQEIHVDPSSKENDLFLPEHLSGKGIGRLTTVIKPIKRWASSPTFDEYLNILNIPRTDKIRKPFREKLARDLRFNLPETKVNVPNHTQAVSALFLVHIKDGSLSIVWGKNDPTTNTGDLHSSLIEAINNDKKPKIGTHIVSGHIAHIYDTDHYFSLLDSLSKSTSQKLFTEDKVLIAALYNLNFIPLTTEGKILLPEYY